MKNYLLRVLLLLALEVIRAPSGSTAHAFSGFGATAAAISSAPLGRLHQHRDQTFNKEAGERTRIIRPRQHDTLYIALCDEAGNDEQSIETRCSVAVLLPEKATESQCSDSDQWRRDASHQLEKIAKQCELPVIDAWGDEQRSGAQRWYSHCLTAVPHPPTNSYAIAIYHNGPSPPVDGKRGGKRKRNKKTPARSDPLFVDLCPPSGTSLGYRVNRTRGRKELLAQALGIRKLSTEKGGDGAPLVIYDLTAGMARDSLVTLSSLLANDGDLGTTRRGRNSRPRLHLAERDPVVASLLRDALRRLGLSASRTSAESSAASSRLRGGGDDAVRRSQCLSMEEGDGVFVLKRLASTGASSGRGAGGASEVPYPPDVVYLDPMFPPRKKKSSAVKKDLAVLQSLLDSAGGSASDAEMARTKEEKALLVAACNAATRRVVVKRPIGAQPLGVPSESHEAVVDVNDANSVPKPSYEIRGSVNRFDVYIVKTPS
ncbi:hypothetical protein ACHAWF_012054 [Thalassiosira exigua]